MAGNDGILKKTATIAELPPVQSTSANLEKDSALKQQKKAWINNKKKRNRRDAEKKSKNSQGSNNVEKVTEKALAAQPTN